MARRALSDLYGRVRVAAVPHIRAAAWRDEPELTAVRAGDHEHARDFQRIDRSQTKAPNRVGPYGAPHRDERAPTPSLSVASNADRMAFAVQGRKRRQVEA